MPLRCGLTVPAHLHTMNPSVRRVVWREKASEYGVDNLHITRGIRASSELAAHVPSAVLRKLNQSSLLPPTVRHAQKHLAHWANSRRFHSSVVAANSSAMFLEDDAILLPGFCASATRALRALAESTWGLLFLGHCAESIAHIRSCQVLEPEPAFMNGTHDAWLSRGVYPMCGHAFIASPRGSAKWLAHMMSWPGEYTDRVLDTAVPGWETAGVSRRRRPEKRPVDDGVDVAVAKLVHAGNLEAYLAWPQTSLQPWMTKRTAGAIARGTSDMILPRVCSRARGRQHRRFGAKGVSARW